MNRETVRTLKEGVGFGVIGGIIMALAMMIGAAAAGEPAVQPLRLVASVVMGSDALVATGGGVLLTGLLAHLVLSAIFGAVYGLFDSALSRDLRSSYGWQAGLGLVFGVALWLVNYQIIARIIYPWFIDQNQLFHVAMHAVFFGLPLGLMIAASERMVFMPPRTVATTRF